jgi:hypothetical protein
VVGVSLLAIIFAAWKETADAPITSSSWGCEFATQRCNATTARGQSCDADGRKTGLPKAQKPGIWLEAWSSPQTHHTGPVLTHCAKARLHNSEQQELCKYLCEKHMCKQNQTPSLLWACHLKPHHAQQTNDPPAAVIHRRSRTAKSTPVKKTHTFIPAQK